LPENIDPGQKAPFEITVGTNDVMGGDLSIIDLCYSGQFIGFLLFYKGLQAITQLGIIARGKIEQIKNSCLSFPRIHI
jgi:hypothetical protein